MFALVSDGEVYALLKKEAFRQENSLNLIPSENNCSKSVLEANSSILISKYSEGYPGRRYYQGNKFIDEIELLAIERVKKLFHAEHANVQPLSGSLANMAVYFALLKPGDKVMAMALTSGGHLTQGSIVNFSGQYYNFVQYSVERGTETLDMQKISEIAEIEKPQMIISGYAAYPRIIDFQRFHEIARSVGAISMADISHVAGLVVSGDHPSPFPSTDVVTTTTQKTLRGPRSAVILCKEEFAQKIDRAVFPGLQGGPHENSIAAKAVCFGEAMKPDFKEYTKQVVRNAKALAEELMCKGIKLVSDGTDNHLLLIDLINTKSIAKPGFGKMMAQLLEDAGIVTNANTIPFDPSSPLTPSGIRIGTPFLTTRGMKEPEMRIIGTCIADIINHPSDSSLKSDVKRCVRKLCIEFPLR